MFRKTQNLLPHVFMNLKKDWGGVRAQQNKIFIFNFEYLTLSQCFLLIKNKANVNQNKQKNKQNKANKKKKTTRKEAQVVL